MKKILKISKCGLPCGYWKEDGWNERAICTHTKNKKDFNFSYQKQSFPKNCPLENIK